MTSKYIKYKSKFNFLFNYQLIGSSLAESVFHFTLESICQQSREYLFKLDSLVFPLSESEICVERKKVLDFMKYIEINRYEENSSINFIDEVGEFPRYAFIDMIAFYLVRDSDFDFVECSECREVYSHAEVEFIEFEEIVSNGCHGDSSRIGCCRCMKNHIIFSELISLSVS